MTAHVHEVPAITSRAPVRYRVRSGETESPTYTFRMSRFAADGIRLAVRDDGRIFDELSIERAEPGPPASALTPAP